MPCLAGCGSGGAETRSEHLLIGDMVTGRATGTIIGAAGAPSSK